MRFLKNDARRVAAWLAVAVLACGCSEGDGLQREAVSGKVTFDGKPLDRGSIQFLPMEANQGAGAWGEVVNGAYSIAASDGPVAGKYSVSISSVSKASATTSVLPRDDEGQVDPHAIPEVYNLRTTLDATVKAGELNEHNYDLTSKPAARKGRRS